MHRTSSMRSEMLVMIKGSQSLANPGSMPLTKIDAPPSAAALRMGSASGVAVSPWGNCRNTGLLDTTLMPAPQEHREVVERLHQTVVGHGCVHDAVRLSSSNASASSSRDAEHTP